MSASVSRSCDATWGENLGLCDSDPACLASWKPARVMHGDVAGRHVSVDHAKIRGSLRDSHILICPELLT
jgi:hypothetical protein